MKILILESAIRENIWVNSYHILYFQREHTVNNSGKRRLFTRIYLTYGSLLVTETCENIRSKMETQP